MYLSKDKLAVDFGKNLKSKKVFARYRQDWTVSDEADGYHLTASGRLLTNAGYQHKANPAELTVVIPHRKLLTDINRPWWPFEELQDGEHAIASWSEVADAIAEVAIKKPHRVDTSKEPKVKYQRFKDLPQKDGATPWSAHYGLLPGNVVYSPDSDKVVFTFDAYAPNFVCFYADKVLASFGGKENHNVFVREDGVEMMFLSTGHVANMMHATKRSA